MNLHNIITKITIISLFAFFFALVIKIIPIQGFVNSEIQVGKFEIISSDGSYIDPFTMTIKHKNVYFRYYIESQIEIYGNAESINSSIFNNKNLSISSGNIVFKLSKNYDLSLLDIDKDITGISIEVNNINIHYLINQSQDLSKKTEIFVFDDIQSDNMLLKSGLLIGDNNGIIFNGKLKNSDGDIFINMTNVENIFNVIINSDVFSFITKLGNNKKEIDWQIKDLAIFMRDFVCGKRCIYLYDRFDKVSINLKGSSAEDVKNISGDISGSMNGKFSFTSSEKNKISISIDDLKLDINDNDFDTNTIYGFSKVFGSAFNDSIAEISLDIKDIVIGEKKISDFHSSIEIDHDNISSLSASFSSPDIGNLSTSKDGLLHLKSDKIETIKYLYTNIFSKDFSIFNDIINDAIKNYTISIKPNFLYNKWYGDLDFSELSFEFGSSSINIKKDTEKQLQEIIISNIDFDKILKKDYIFNTFFKNKIINSYPKPVMFPLSYDIFKINNNFGKYNIDINNSIMLENNIKSSSIYFEKTPQTFNFNVKNLLSDNISGDATFNINSKNGSYEMNISTNLNKFNVNNILNIAQSQNLDTNLINFILPQISDFNGNVAINIDDVGYKDIKNININGNINNGIISIDQDKSSFNFGANASVLSGSIDLSTYPTFNISTKIQNISIKNIIKYYSFPERIDGNISTDLNLKFSGFNIKDYILSLSGQCTINSDNFTILNYNTNEISKRFVAMKNLDFKIQDVLSSGNIKFKNFQNKFEIDGGIFKSNNINIVGNGSSVASSISFNLNTGYLDYLNSNFGIMARNPKDIKSVIIIQMPLYLGGKPKELNYELIPNQVEEYRLKALEYKKNNK
jgi:hypothetical protein